MLLLTTDPQVESSLAVTHSGRCFDPRLPDEASIELDDIAHHLATLARFCGAPLRPYSMAEHALLMVEILERDDGVTDPAGLLAALLYHAPAAYTGDPDTPAVQHGGSRVVMLQTRMMFAIMRRFGLDQAAVATYLVPIFRADQTARATVQRDLIELTEPLPDGYRSYAAAVDWLSLRTRDHMTWQDWRQAFIDRAGELLFARGMREQ